MIFRLTIYAKFPDDKAKYSNAICARRWSDSDITTTQSGHVATDRDQDLAKNSILLLYYSHLINVHDLSITIKGVLPCMLVQALISGRGLSKATPFLYKENGAKLVTTFSSRAESTCELI